MKAIILGVALSFIGLAISVIGIGCHSIWLASVALCLSALGGSLIGWRIGLHLSKIKWLNRIFDNIADWIVK